MRKKSFLGALVGAVVLSAAAVALASPGLVQIADIKLTEKKTNKSTGVSALLTHSDPNAQPPGNIPSSVKFVITLPRGTRVNDEAAPQCNLSTTEVRDNKCPKNTVVGSGTVKANVVFGPQGPVIQDVPGTATAYNRNGALAVRIVTESTSQLPSTTVPIIAGLSKKGVLTVNVPQLQPAGPGSKVILTYLKLNINKKSKTVGRGRKRHKINLLTTPKTCKGRWNTHTVDNYDDGDTRTIDFKAPCKKP